MKIGLTGGIGSGKSTVAAFFEAHGAWRFDADAVSHELTSAGGAAMPAIEQAFGPGVLASDGSLDRAAMRARVFNDAQQRQRLEAILHPLIGARREAVVQAAAGRSVVFDIPLLAESPAWRARVDRVLVVDCLESTQVARVMARSGLQAADIRRIIDSQASRAQRRAVADAVIFNDGLSLQELEQAVAALWGHWQACETMT
ncbi:MAG: dephospho-CoA kinase [Synechococcaceae bacterium WBB_3_034]|jgi:dephospho-CoA kinase|nr:dephospho-CoA kinase [Synechococcaceae bacterium WBB_3_034]